MNVKNLGAELYTLNTKNGTMPITIEVATLMTVVELEEVLLHTYDANMDFITDVVALETVMNCCQVLEEKLRLSANTVVFLSNINAFRKLYSFEKRNEK